MNDTLKEDIRQDVYKLVEIMKDLPMHEQRDLINELFEKYISKKDQILIISEMEFNAIISRAKQRFANNSIPFLGKKQLALNEFANLCVIEATVEFLNANQALRRDINIK